MDALFVTHLPNIFYLTNHSGSAGALVLTADTAHLLVDGRYAESVRMNQASAAASPDTRVWPVPASYDEAVLACLVELGTARVGFEADHLSVSRFDWFRQTIAARGAGTSIVDLSGLFEDSDEWIFEDFVHIRQAGNEKTATAIVDRLLADPEIRAALEAKGKFSSPSSPG